ncbi:MAG: aminoglycoside phosphotransferase family protein [Alphaproteobacteria bacterium]|nr:aminoglycoside phosphotransferase family protein [Alphaproteobacteria bacterium]MBL7096026.1 aminoglycoside phosphotransferase family protein [Alphaproteobacteria bacterium]
MSDDTDIAEALAAMGLGAPAKTTRLSGGVSCDVWRVDVAGRRAAVVKRALPKLRVTADWRAPPERAAAEVAWFRLVAGIEPRWVPAVLGEDRARHMFAMEYLPPETHPVWKAEMAAGRVDVDFAADVGTALATIHAATAGRSDVATTFDNGAQFHALRLEPYLLFTADKHPFVAGAIRDEVARIAAARIALMQGDISPKNILSGPSGPVFLDAETACYGDPAFDVAFCMNHFLLKAVWHPEWTDLYAQSFEAMRAAYLDGVVWENPVEIDRRVARLLPMLFLARADGKSPVEYLTDDESRAFVRGAAMQMIVEPPANLAVLAESYFPVAAQR